jgi:Domain of unknown function (DUF4386)
MKAQPGAGIELHDLQQRIGDSQVTQRNADNSQLAYARFAGLMYFLVLGFDVAGVLIASSIVGGGNFVEASHRIMASETLYRICLCCSLLGSLSTIPLAIGLYVAVKPADGNLAMMALLFRVAEAAIGATGIILAFSVLQIHLAANHANAFNANQLGALADLSSGVGTDVGAIFFSLGSTIFFFVFLKSHYIPRTLSAWGIFASLVYAAAWFVSLILPQYSAPATAYGSVPILIAELSTGLWLLIAGIKVQPRN